MIKAFEIKSPHGLTAEQRMIVAMLLVYPWMSEDYRKWVDDCFLRGEFGKLTLGQLRIAISRLRDLCPGQRDASLYFYLCLEVALTESVGK